MDVNARMRDLENKFLDFKTNFEKRVLIMLEENPQKYLRHLKVMEDKDSVLWKDSFQKHDRLEDEFRGFQELFQKQNEGFYNKIIGLESQIQDCEFKLRSNPVKNPIESSNIFAIDTKEYNGNLVLYDKNNFQELPGSNQLEIEMKLIKEGLFQEQNRRDLLFKDVMGLYKDLNNMVHKHENELIQRFKQQKEEISLENTVTKEQSKKLDLFKTESLNNENSLVKNMISALEKKLNEETDKRMGLEYEIKRLVEGKIMGFKDENVRNEKNFLENEQKYMKQIQESFTSLNQIIRSNKDQLEADLTSTQTMTNENFKTLSKTLDFLRETMSGKLIIIDNAIKDQNLTLNGVVEDNNKKIEEFHKGITKELERNEKIIGVFEIELGRIMKEVDGKMDGSLKNLEEWKKKYEGKTQGIFREMNVMLKGFKEEVFLEKNDKNEKIKQLIKEQEAFSKMNSELFENLKVKLNNLNENLEYKLKENAINWQAENLINAKKFKDSLEEIQRNCNEKMEKNVIENIYNLNKKLTFEFKKELNTNQEKSQAIFEENRQKILTDLAYNDQKTEGLVNKLKEEFMFKNNSNIKQIQGFSEEIRSYKEENKENLRKITMDFEQNSETLANKMENKIKSTSLDNKEDFSCLLAKKSKEFQSDLLKNSHESSLQIKSLEKQIERALENNGTNLLNNIKEEMLKESSRIEEKFKVLEKTVDANKRMTLEANAQTAESTKALCRALINEESAKREKSLEDLLKLTKFSLESTEKLLINKMEKLSEELERKLKQKSEELEQALLAMESKNSKELKEMREINEKGIIELSTEIYYQRILKKQREVEYDETVKNIEIRFMNLEDLLKKINEINEEKNMGIIKQIEGNREILKENHRILKDYGEVLKDHQEGLEVFEEKIEDLEVKQQEHEEKIEILEENGKENDEFFEKVRGNFKDHEEKLEKTHEKLLNHEEKLEKHEEKLENHTEKLEKINEKLLNNEEKLDKHEEKLEKHEEKLENHTEKLERINEKLLNNEEKLDKHEENLEKIHENLKNHDEKLENHLENLLKINEKLLNNDEKLEKHEENLEKNNEKLITDEKKIEELQKIANKIDEELNGNNANMYEMDDKFSKYIENIYLEMESRNYLNDLYNQIQCEEDLKTDSYLRSKINKTSYQITKIMEKIDESDKIFDQFEVKTDNNFQIAEKAIKAHTKFLNEIDARLTIEELYNKVCHRGNEETLKKSIGVLAQQIESISSKQQENYSGSVKGNKEALQGLKQIEEKINENGGRIDLLFEGMKKHGNFLNELDAKMVSFLLKFLSGIFF